MAETAVPTEQLGARRLVGILLVCSAVFLLGFGIVRSGFIQGARSVLGLSSSGGPASIDVAGGRTSDGQCSNRALRVTVAPELEEPVTTALAAVTSADPCAQFTVTAQRPHKVLSSMTDTQHPDIWVPDSSTWTDALPTTMTWTNLGSVAHSPIVLAAPAASGMAAPGSWVDVIPGPMPVLISDPERDGSSRLAYVASRFGQSEKMSLTTGAKLIFTSRFARASVDDLLQLSKEGGTDRPFPVSEQVLAQFDKANPGVLVRLVPKAGTTYFDYPFLTAPGLPSNLTRTAQKAYAALSSGAGAQTLREAGFRGVDNSGGPQVARAAAPSFRAMAPLTAKARRQALEQYKVLRTDMRMVVLADVSGSMNWPAKDSTQKRIDVLIGACLDGLRVIPGGSQIGVRIFSSDQAKGGIDYRDMAEITQLDGPSPDGQPMSYRQALLKLVPTAPKYIRGDTGLYDSVYATWKKVQSSYDEKFVNSVVVLTDGVNDDPNGGLSLPQLLAKFKAESDPKRPVRVVTIGMGEADPKALGAISTATGGTSYIANTAKDIERVFVEALLARSVEAGRQ